MKLLFTLLLVTFTTLLIGQGTPGTLDVSVTTLPNGIDFSPKHILAIWIEDGSGNFVKTLKLNADKRKQYLYTWNTKSSGNTTDATTGATLGLHTTHSVSWPCTNTTGVVVDDGNYSVWIEYTSEHAQGPITSIDFNKATDNVTFQPTDETYFIDMDLVYTPESTIGINNSSISYKLEVYPVPASEQLFIDISLPSSRQTSIKIYQSDMRLVNIIWDGDISAGEHRFSWDLNSVNGAKVAAGTYFMVVSGSNLLSTRQIVVQ